MLAIFFHLQGVRSHSFYSYGCKRNREDFQNSEVSSKQYQSTYLQNPEPLKLNFVFIIITSSTITPHGWLKGVTIKKSVLIEKI